MSNSLVTSYIEDIAKRIHDSTLYGQASVMVGAGFSKNAEVTDAEVSSPNWEELAVSMFELLYKKPVKDEEINAWEIQKIKKTSGRNVLKLAEEYKAVFGRNKLNKFIEKNINDGNYIPGELHKKLLSLNWRDVFTTNYDTLLERTIDKIDVKFNYEILSNQSDLPGSTHPRIIKLHGCVESEKNYIISEEDYRTYPIQFAPLVNTVQQAMLETQLCLIGFSGDDPNFLNWLGWLRDNMGENCPNIYLIGLFQNMSDAEKMTLESQNITIVDLGDMFEESVGHQEALNVFLDKLTEYGRKKEIIFEQVPYQGESYKYDFYKTIDDVYFMEMNNFLTKMRNKIDGYLALPTHYESREFIKTLKHHFVALLKLDPSIQQIKLLSKNVYFLRRGYAILEDSDAKRILKIFKCFSEEELQNDKKLLSAWIEVSLYLLEMYRIDGLNEEYNVLLTEVENNIHLLVGFTKEEIQIEKCKFLISKFDYIQAKSEIEKINHNVALEIQLKKVFLYKQIGEEVKGEELLRKSSALLTQKKYSENKTASLKGYLNLSARSLMSSFSRNPIDDKFSDKDYYLNQYNVRNIYNQIKNNVSNSLLLAYTKTSRGEIQGFNPGTYKLSYGTATKIEQDAVINPLSYIMFQDLLCLPNTFSDHKEILALGLKEIIQTSTTPTWKWSSIIRTNDEKIINAFFTRELIVSANPMWVEELFNQLMELSEVFNSNYGFSNQSKIITQQTIFDILTRLSIAVDDEKVIQLINKIIKLSKEEDDFINRKLITFFNRLKISFNVEVISHYFNKLLESETMPLEFLLVFVESEIKVKIDQFNLNDKTFDKIISELYSQDTDVRNRGVAKVILINSFSNFGKYKHKTAEALWSQLNDRGFPKSSGFYAWAWETLPYIEDINFKNLYAEYLKDPKFKRSVKNGGISGIMSIDAPIDEYIQLFGRVSLFNKQKDDKLRLPWTPQYFVNTAKYIYDYIDNEKSLLTTRIDIFGSREEAVKRFSKLGNFVAILSAQAYYSNQYTDEVEVAVNECKLLLREHDIISVPLDLMDNLFAKILSENDIEKLMSQITFGSREQLSQIMDAIDILLMFEDKELLDVKVTTHILELIKSLKYFDRPRNSTVIYQLTYIIGHPLLIQENNSDVVIVAFNEYLSKLDLSLKNSDRDLIESIYSFSVLVRRYYDKMIQYEMHIPDKLLTIMDELSHTRLKEVSYMWKDIPLK